MYNKSTVGHISSIVCLWAQDHIDHTLMPAVYVKLDTVYLIVRCVFSLNHGTDRDCTPITLPSHTFALE